MRIIGLVIILAMLALSTGEIAPFLDVPSAILTLGLTIGALIFAGASIPTMFSAAFSAAASREQLQAAARGWAQARTYAVAAGFIGTLIGIVVMLNHLDDLSQIGPGAALAILTILYGLLLGYGLCLPMQMHLEDRARQVPG